MIPAPLTPAPHHPLKNAIHFISDLHLSLDKPEITRRFLNYLQNQATQAQSLYILGDLFDAWVGDDDNTPPIPAIKQALQNLVAQGTLVYLLQGNRDFLMGSRFAQETGVQLLDDYACIEIDGQSVLLTHGDLLCSDDIAYQAFRSQSRTPQWQANVLGKPLWLRLLAARWYRLRSYYHKRSKNLDIMDVNQQTVLQVMRQFNCRTLIHGHTHRPQHHQFELDHQAAHRLVLADWKKESGAYLCWDGTHFTQTIL